MSELPDAPRIWTTEDELKTHVSCKTLYNFFIS